MASEAARKWVEERTRSGAFSGLLGSVATEEERLAYAYDAGKIAERDRAIREEREKDDERRRARGEEPESLLVLGGPHDGKRHPYRGPKIHYWGDNVENGPIAYDRESYPVESVPMPAAHVYVIRRLSFGHGREVLHVYVYHGTDK